MVNTGLKYLPPKSVLRAEERSLIRYLRHMRRIRMRKRRILTGILVLMSVLYLAGMAAAGGKLMEIASDHEVIWQLPGDTGGESLFRLHVNLSRGEFTITRETMR